MRVAAIQMESAAGDKAANLDKIGRLAREARAGGAEVIAFPECAVTGYWFMRNLTPRALRALAEPVPSGPSTQALQGLARELGAVVGAGLVEAGEDGRLFNTWVAALPDGRHARHRKLHAFEHDLMCSGDELTVFETPGGVKCGVLICYDCNLIENVRMTALAGAQVLLAPHQTGGCRGHDPNQMGVVPRELWDRRREDPEAIEAEFKGGKGRGWLMRWLPARAHDNGIFVVFANGVGVDDDEIRTGNAMVIDPYGRILAETWAARDEIVAAELDLPLAKDTTGGRWIQARRPELYGPLTQRTGRERTARQLKFQE